MPKDTIFYSQLQPWSSVAAEPCMEQVAGPPIANRLGITTETPKAHPWRPTLGYEMVSSTPLPSMPVTNAMIDPCYTPYGMATEPLHYPNLITGFDRNPAHAARAALYTRYTPTEWNNSNLGQYNESDTLRNYSERLRQDFIKVLKETDEQTAQEQRLSGRTIGERLTDVSFWRNELSNELQRLAAENLTDQIRGLEKAMQDLEGPLHIDQECLYQREKREGIELVHDHVEQTLLKEIEIIKSYYSRFRDLIEKCKEQQRNNRACQDLLETDVRSKDGALGIDNMCHQLNNYSSGIAYYGGIEKFDPTTSTTQTWAENSNRTVLRSQQERARSNKLRTDVENLINQCAIEIWDAWSNTNNSLARRASELLEHKSKLQFHLQKIQHEIFDVEKTMELLRKAIVDKTAPLKVAQTRLEARSHRRGIENSRDEVQNKLVVEVKHIQDSVDKIHRKLQEAEAQHQQLLRTRNNLEADLAAKVNALFIDREKCMGLRRSFPITTTIKY